MNAQSTLSLAGMAKRLASPQRDGGIQPLAVIVTFALFLALGFIFPYTGDDWTWGSYVGLGRMENDFFAHYNGRYLGNVIVLVLTRVLWLRALAVAVATTGIVYGCYAFIAKDKRWMYWLVLALVLFTQHELRSECIVWTAGFTNYAIPLAMFVGWTNVFKGVFADEYLPPRGRWFVPLALLGFALCLFLETITICTVAASAALVVYARLRHRKIDAAQIAFLAGAFIGAVVMFSNETYHDQGAFHSIAAMNTLREVAKTCAKVTYEGYVQNMALNVCLFAVLAFGLRRCSPEGTVLGMTRKRVRTLTAVTGALAAFSTFMAFSGMKGKLAYAADACALAVFLAVVALLAVALWRAANDHRGAFLVGCAVALTLPLIVVSPVTWRCFFPESLVQVVFMGVLASAVTSEAGEPRISLAKVLGATCAAGFAMWFAIYGTVYSVYCHRGDDIQQQLDAGQKTIVLERLPFARHIQHNDSIIESNEYNMRQRFFIYYGIPDDCTVVFVEHDELPGADN